MYDKGCKAGNPTWGWDVQNAGTSFQNHLKNKAYHDPSNIPIDAVEPFGLSMCPHPGCCATFFSPARLKTHVENNCSANYTGGAKRARPGTDSHSRLVRSIKEKLQRTLGYGYRASD